MICTNCRTGEVTARSGTLCNNCMMAAWFTGTLPDHTGPIGRIKADGSDGNVRWRENEYGIVSVVPNSEYELRMTFPDGRYLGFHPDEVDVLFNTKWALAKSILAIASDAGMPDTFWDTDRRIMLARHILGQRRGVPISVAEAMQIGEQWKDDQ